jgi:primosomal protein N'
LLFELTIINANLKGDMMITMLFAQNTAVTGAELENAGETAVMVLGVIILLTIYWSLRGFIGLFQRHNAILVIVYLVLLFPIAYIHMLLLGIFGNSKKERLNEEVNKEVKKMEMVQDKLKKDGYTNEVKEDHEEPQQELDSTELKLKKIDNLKKKGLINEEEDEEKRKSIIDGF